MQIAYNHNAFTAQFKALLQCFSVQ